MPTHTETSLTVYPQSLCYIILAKEEEHVSTSSNTLMLVCNYKYNKTPSSNYNKRVTLVYGVNTSGGLWKKNLLK